MQVEGIASHPYQPVFALINSTAVTIWSPDQLDRPQKQWPLENAQADHAAFIEWNHTGHILVVGYTDTEQLLRVEVWSYPEHKRLALYRGSGSIYIAGAIHPHEPLLAITAGRQITIWNWQTDQRTMLQDTDSMQLSAALSADGAWLASEKYLYDLQNPHTTPQRLRELGFGGNSLAIHPTEPLLFINNGGRLVRYNLHTKSIEQQVDCFRLPISSIAVSADGALLAVGQGWAERQGDGAPDIQIRRTDDLSLVTSIPATGRGIVSNLAFTAKDEALLVQAEDFNDRTRGLTNDDQVWLIPLQ